MQHKQKENKHFWHFIFIFRTSMEWTEQHDNCLCQEILVLEPFKAKKGSIARGQIWDKIAINLNSLEHPQMQSDEAICQRTIYAFERQT